MWFIEQSWLEYFLKERIPTWATGEDMHLSHTLRKYLNLDTFGGRGVNGNLTLPKSRQTTVGPALHLREHLFDHQLGRGNKVAAVRSPIQTLVYAESLKDINDYIAKTQSCDKNDNAPWCSGGKTAVIFRGGMDQDVAGMIQQATALCNMTNCGYFAVKPKIKHKIQYFNMRQQFGQSDEDEIPYQTQVSDLLTSLVGVLNNVSPVTLFIPEVSNRKWKDTETMRERLQIYRSTVLLAVQIHQNTKRIVGMQEHLQAKYKPDNPRGEDGFPVLIVYAWKYSAETINGPLYRREIL